MAKSLSDWAQSFLDADEAALEIHPGTFCLETNVILNSDLSHLAALNEIHRDLSAVLASDAFVEGPVDWKASNHVIDSGHVWSIVPSAPQGLFLGRAISLTGYQGQLDVSDIEYIERRVLQRFEESLVRITSLLRLVRSRISTLLRLVGQNRSVLHLFVRQSAFFITHGEHPPRESGRVVVGPIARAGAFAAY
jgi:hypothetical protein